MQRCFRWIVKHRTLVITLFVVAAIVCGFLQQFVRVDYDVTNYLPDKAPSTVALQTLDDEFDDAVPNARVMIPDVSVYEALEYKERMSEIDGVASVMWLDDVINIGIPLEMQDQQTIERYYKDGDALFTVAVEDAKRIEAVTGIRDIVGDEGALTGSAVSLTVATIDTIKEIVLVSIVAVLFVLLVLALTTKSWLEPLIVLVGLGIAVVINAGTNLMFGTISFVTNSAGAVLQLAIALDFSVFLLHRYHEGRDQFETADEAMVWAMNRSKTAILSSACTVTIGFLALGAMQFKIGPDLGFALAKGIVISFISVFSFLACLLVAADHAIARTTHRSFLPPTGGLAKFLRVATVPIMIAFVLLAVPSWLATTSPENEYWYGSSRVYAEGTRFGDDTARIVERFGESDTYVLMVPKGNLVNEASLSHDLHQLDDVAGIISYVDLLGTGIPQDMVPPTQLARLESDTVSRMLLDVQVPLEGDRTFELVDQIRDIAQQYYPDTWLLAGEGVSTADLKTTVTHDKMVVDLVSVAAVFLVLLLAMKSLTLPIILVMVIEVAIWMGTAAQYYAGTTEFYLSILISGAILLGVTVDYAILFADRYKEERRKHHRKHALLNTIEAVTVPILTSGSAIVVVGFLLSWLSTNQILAELGLNLGRGALISLAGVFFALPGFLMLFDAVIGKTTLHANFLRKNEPGVDDLPVADTPENTAELPEAAEELPENTAELPEAADQSNTAAIAEDPAAEDDGTTTPDEPADASKDDDVR